MARKRVHTETNDGNNNNININNSISPVGTPSPI